MAVASLLAALRENAAGRSRRACAQGGGGTAHLEVVWSSRRPSLHQVIDQGTVGFNAKQYMFGEGHLRGTVEAGPPHRRHNNALWSLAQANLTWATLELQVLQCFSSAPWRGSAHSGALRRSQGRR